MAIVIPAPNNLTIVDDCADWIELVSLVADDGNASAGDLERLLKRSGTFDGWPDEDEAVEQHCSQTVQLLANRAEHAGDGYPFSLGTTALSRRAEYDDRFLPYIFCLCLSHYRAQHPTVDGVNPRLLFEQVCASALEGYLGTHESLVFGTGRKDEFERQTFVDAVDRLAVLIGEGAGFKNQPSLSKKDDHLDVVAVKTFPDKRHSKLVLFGQCATGMNWESKISEMDPDAFCRHWFSETVTSTPSLVKTFFVPFVVPDSRWRYVCNYAGIVFERLRVSKYAPKGKTIENIRAPMTSWINACLA